MKIDVKELIAALQAFANQLGHHVVPSARLVDYVIHEYSSYEEYRSTQIKYNKLKIEKVWADELTLKRVANLIEKRSRSSHLGERFSAMDRATDMKCGSLKSYYQTLM